MPSFPGVRQDALVPRGPAGCPRSQGSGRMPSFPGVRRDALVPRALVLGEGEGDEVGGEAGAAYGDHDEGFAVEFVGDRRAGGVAG